MSYQAMQEQFPRLFKEQFEITYEEVWHNKWGHEVSQASFAMPMLELLTKMKINCEEFDVCTVLWRQIVQAVAGKHYFGRLNLLWLLAMCFTYFGSRELLTSLRDLAQEHGPELRRSQVLHRIRQLCREGCPSRLFTGSFCPNRIRRNKARKKKKGNARDVLKSWDRWRGLKKRLHPGLLFSPKISRRAFMIQLAGKFGPFSGKNFYQCIRVAFPNKRCCGSFVYRRALKRDRFSLCGPGARVALNMLAGWPKGYSLGDNDPCTHEVFNGELIRWMGKWRKLVKATLPKLPKPLQQHAEALLSQDETAFQFHMCELGKKANYAETRNRIYERGYER